MRTNLIGVLVGFVVGLALVPALAPSPAQARDGSELVLFLKLNGERSRQVQADGGGLLFFVNDGGIGSVTVSAGAVYYFENVGAGVCHLCTPNPDQTTWDGGCNTTSSDPNYGSLLAVGAYRWISMRDTTTSVKAVQSNGSAATPCTIDVRIMR